MKSPLEFRKTWAEIDLLRLVSNYRHLAGLSAPGSFVCPMVKANAYGHGDVGVSRALVQAGASWLGVGLIEEGVRLRLAGLNCNILMFGLFDVDGARAMVEYRLTPVLSDWSQLEALEQVLPADRSRPVHLKFNTGMNRLGFDVAEASRLKAWFADHPVLQVEGVCTHLARGEDAGRPGGQSEPQFLRLKEVRKVFSEPDLKWHVTNSAGTLNLAQRSVRGEPLSAGATWPIGIRPGLAMYGIAPENEENGSEVLQPVLSLKSQIVKVQRIKSGERVSYNGTWQAKRESVIGVVPMGYADGYSRLLSNRGSVLCQGRRVPVVGNVCMDYFMIELTDIEQDLGPVAPGLEVVLIGHQGGETIPVAELAQMMGTISYEVLTRIGERVPRHFIGDSSSPDVRNR